MPFPPLPSEHGALPKKWSSLEDLDNQLWLTTQDVHALYIYLERLRQLSFDEITSIVGDEILNTFIDSSSIDFTVTENNVTAVVANDGITTLKIVDKAITYQKIQDINSNKLLGRGFGVGQIQEITIGTGLNLTGTTLSVSGSTSFDPDTILVDASGNVVTSDGNVLVNS